MVLLAYAGPQDEVSLSPRGDLRFRRGEVRAFPDADAERLLRACPALRRVEPLPAHLERLATAELSFARTASDSLGDRRCSVTDPRRGGQVGGGSEAGGRYPQAMGAATEKRGSSVWDGGRPAARCGLMPPAGRIDDAGPRRRESARPCPPPAARWASRLAHPSRARGAFVLADKTRSRGSRCSGGVAHEGSGHGRDTRAGPSR